MNYSLVCIGDEQTERGGGGGGRAIFATSKAADWGASKRQPVASLSKAMLSILTCHKVETAGLACNARVPTARDPKLRQWVTLQQSVMHRNATSTGHWQQSNEDMSFRTVRKERHPNHACSFQRVRAPCKDGKVLGTLDWGSNTLVY